MTRKKEADQGREEALGPDDVDGEGLHQHDDDGADERPDRMATCHR